jgi:hypothetical protein
MRDALVSVSPRKTQMNSAASSTPASSPAPSVPSSRNSGKTGVQRVRRPHRAHVLATLQRASPVPAHADVASDDAAVRTAYIGRIARCSVDAAVRAQARGDAEAELGGRSVPPLVRSIVPELFTVTN